MRIRWLLLMFSLALLVLTGWLIRDGMNARKQADRKRLQEQMSVPAVAEPVQSEEAPVPATDTATESVTSQLDATGQIDTTKTLARLPKTEAEIVAAYRSAQAHVCEVIPSGQPFEVQEFTPYLSESDRPRRNGDPPIPSLRLHVLSVGLDLDPDEKLPVLSRGQIEAYVAGHFVSIQSRIRRDPVTGARYLHHRPMAEILAYRGPSLTKDHESAVVAPIRDFRSLGLFLEPDEQTVPENLRTLVLLHRHVLASSGPFPGDPRVERPNYEYVFIRARLKASDEDGDLELHAFATTEQRRQLHYLQPSPTPLRAADCSIRTASRFTRYTHGGLYPADGVVTDVKLQSRKTYSVERLDQYASASGLRGTLFDHLPIILDAVIDAKII